MHNLLLYIYIYIYIGCWIVHLKSPPQRTLLQSRKFSSFFVKKTKNIRFQDTTSRFMKITQISIFLMISDFAAFFEYKPKRYPYNFFKIDKYG